MARGKRVVPKMGVEVHEGTFRVPPSSQMDPRQSCKLDGTTFHPPPKERSCLHKLDLLRQFLSRLPRCVDVGYIERQELNPHNLTIFP